MRQYSEWETMKRVWDVEEIKDLMSRRAVYSANEERERELKELWVNQPDHMATASFGRNYGYYVGMDAIRSYYVDSHQTRIDALSVSSITSLSTPKPSPPVGARPYSRAVT